MTISRNFRNQVKLVNNVLVGVKLVLMKIRSETHRYCCVLSTFQQKTSTLFFLLSTHQEIMQLISHVLNNKISFRILEIPRAQYFIQNHSILKTIIYTKDTALFYSLTTPTLLQYNAVD